MRSRQLKQAMMKLSAAKESALWHWLPCSVMVVLLATGVAVLATPLFYAKGASLPFFTLRRSVWGLALAAALAAVYILVRQAEFHRVLGRLTERDTMFQLITGHAADMIAVVDVHGKRLYNSPSYQTVLGYTPEELAGSWAFEQIHPEDREKVIKTAEEARSTGVGHRMEYRVRHKDSSWRVLESTANAIRNPTGEVEKLVIVNRDITERRRAEQQLEHNALHDTLTDLPNRTVFLGCLQRAFERAEKDPKELFAVLLVGIDGVDTIEGSMGHGAGDQLIVKMAHRLTACLRYGDVVSRGTLAPAATAASGDGVLTRLDGDEFAILLSGIGHASDALRVARRIQQELSVAVEMNGQEIFPSASIGIALSDTPHSSPNDMLRDAGVAMYRAKSLGNGQCEIFGAEMHASAVRRLKLETDLHKALDRSELEVYYQPIVRLETGHIEGFEALVRWNHPHDGFLAPSCFLSVAEETGLIAAIDKWVLRESCRTAQAWQLQYGSEGPLTITVNVSAKQLVERDLVKEVEAVLEETNLSPHRLQLEITESIAMTDPEKTVLMLSRLKDLGVRVSIDDFGTGHSSLGRLREFPADVLKVDRSFVARIQHRRNRDSEIVRLITMLAHGLDLHVVAEGIETRAQLDFLEGLGCEFGQGYLFSKPVNHEHAQQLLANGRSLGLEHVRAFHHTK
jgi:PAS domain S-box-containing protein